jgi:hypothetical protein
MATAPVKVDAYQATASSSNVNNQPQEAIDGLLGSDQDAWLSDDADSAPWLKLEFHDYHKFIEYRFSRGFCTVDAYFVGSWTLWGGDSSYSMEVIDEVLDDQSARFPIATACSEFGPTYQISTPGVYRYYRFDFTASPFSANSGVSIGEIELFE